MLNTMNGRCDEEVLHTLPPTTQPSYSGITIGVNDADFANSPVPQPLVPAACQANASHFSCRYRSPGESCGGRHSCARTTSAFNWRMTRDQCRQRFTLPARRKLYVTIRIEVFDQFSDGRSTLSITRN